MPDDDDPGNHICDLTLMHQTVKKCIPTYTELLGLKLFVTRIGLDHTILALYIVLVVTA